MTRSFQRLEPWANANALGEWSSVRSVWKLVKCAQQLCDKWNRCAGLKTHGLCVILLTPLLGLDVLFGLKAAFKHFYSDAPDMSDWNEDWSLSRPMGTVCCATVDVKVCLLSVDTSLYPWHMSRENEGVVHELTVPTGINRVTVHELSSQLPKWRCGELSRTRLARGFIPWLTARIHGVRPFVRNLGRFQRSLTKGFNRIRHLRDGDSHTLGKCCTRPVELHNATSSAMLALPSAVVRGRLEHSEAKLRFVLPHLSCHIVLPSQLIGKTVSVCVETRLPTPSPWFEWFLPGDLPSKFQGSRRRRPCP